MSPSSCLCKLLHAHAWLYMYIDMLRPQGYYMQGDVFGARGDFITSPEISQVFGEVSNQASQTVHMPCVYVTVATGSVGIS